MDMQSQIICYNRITCDNNKYVKRETSKLVSTEKLLLTYFFYSTMQVDLPQHVVEFPFKHIRSSNSHKKSPMYSIKVILGPYVHISVDYFYYHSLTSYS